MKKIEAHKHFFIGENKQWFPTEDFIIHLADPRCFIRLESVFDMLASYEEFRNAIIAVQWIDGRPKEHLMEQTLINAYNFLIIEDEILNDLEDTVCESDYLDDTDLPF